MKKQTWVEKVYAKILYYRERPWMIRKNFSAFYARMKYKFFLAVDPPPKQRRKELTADYFDRIHPKYGLRFYTAMNAMTMGIDLAAGLPMMEKDIKNKKERKLLKDLLITLAGIEQQNLEYYKKFLIRTEALKNT